MTTAERTPPPWSPAQALPDALARHLRRWAARRGAPPDAVDAAGEAARRLGEAMADGHVCIGLDELPGAPGAWRARLAASGLLGTPATPGQAPLILDDDGRLYLHRAFDDERRLAHRLLQAVRQAPPDVAPEQPARLQTLFQANEASLSPGEVDWQKLAAALALRGRLAVISGGPGTGKTTTVVNLLACVLAQQPDTRIALAAPTGKAAARLSEALAARAGHLDADLRARLPLQATTVHRLLRAGPRGFEHDAAHPLPVDLLLVDEASMLDLALAVHLLEAVPPHARVLLLGDKDQLAAVESGAVFAELSAQRAFSAAGRAALAALAGLSDTQATTLPAAAGAAAPLADHVVWFTRSFRFTAESGIGTLAAAVRDGDAAAAIARLRQGGADLRWTHEPATGPAAATRAALHDAVDAYAAVLRRDPADHAAVARAFQAFRVLCALREGPRGVSAVNVLMRQRLQARLAGSGLSSANAADDGDALLPGQPVLVRRNDAALRLFNGDIGLWLPDARGEWGMHFPDVDGAWRSVSPARLPPHDTAFAMTVHQSQGSEFDQVAVLLPAQPHRLATRELLYTALTRARHQVHLDARAAVVQAAIDAPTRRRSGLRARLAEAAAGAGHDAVMPASQSAA